MQHIAPIIHVESNAGNYWKEMHKQQERGAFEVSTSSILEVYEHVV
jgi:hypothetical protein